MLNYLVLTINGQKEYYWASESYIKDRMNEIKNSYEKFVEVQYWNPYEKTGKNAYSTHVKINDIQKFDWIQSSKYLDRQGDDINKVVEESYYEEEDYEEEYQENDYELEQKRIQEEKLKEEKLKEEKLKEQKRLKEIKDKEDQEKKERDLARWNKIKAERAERDKKELLDKAAKKLAKWRKKNN